MTYNVIAEFKALATANTSARTIRISEGIDQDEDFKLEAFDAEGKATWLACGQKKVTTFPSLLEALEEATQEIDAALGGQIDLL